MKQAIEILKEDHARLRKILNTLERLLKESDVPEMALKLVLDHLDRGLEKHLKKEENYLMPALLSVTGELKGYHNERDHEDIRTSIQFLKIVLREKYATSVTDTEAIGSHLIDTLREHMIEEEETVFPIAERALGEKVLGDLGGQITSDQAGSV